MSFHKLFILLTGFLLQISDHLTAELKNSIITLPNSESDRHSLDFILPDPGDELGLQCRQFSAYFCMMGYRLYKKESVREPQQDDAQQFEVLVRDKTHRLNWFSFKEQDKRTGLCCTHQINMYVENGQRNGLSPQKYLDKIFEFPKPSTTQREVVFVKVRWVAQSCTHVISQLGFGRGKLRIVGGRGLTKKFAIPPVGKEATMYVLTGYQIKTQLAFPWFMLWIICGEKPWMCPDADGQTSISGIR
ncbi:uncharacterized protein LOC142338196 [Convolutriloba macropyga]|uniref:uncharacterized protein LOC142338196 n=1 Tax=Convolutriloba macropyga TaxID=536237 RepID=UPI003F52533A